MSALFPRCLFPVNQLLRMALRDRIQVRQRAVPIQQSSPSLITVFLTTHKGGINLSASALYKEKYNSKL